MRIYVIIAGSGDYSDHTEQPVCWMRDEHAAQAMLAKLQAHTDAYRAMHARHQTEFWNADALAKTTMPRELLAQSVDKRHKHWLESVGQVQERHAAELAALKASDPEADFSDVEYSIWTVEEAT